MSNDPAIAVPVLPSLNIDETEAFYRDWLGFHERVYRADDYLIVRRRHLELHFWLTQEDALPKSSSVYIRGGEVPALFVEYDERQVQGLSPFFVRPWNMKEFYVHDPHGNLLRFGCSPKELAN